MSRPKQYDQAYFDKWYRDPGHRVTRPSDVARKVGMVLGITEFLLGRPVRSVLDVGCGEGAWQPVLHRLRPRARYAGVDASPYVVRRYGARRNIRLGSFDRLAEVGLAEAYDLVVCCDVLHYLRTPELRDGLAFLRPRITGLAFLEAYTPSDDIDGDREGFARRSAAEYRDLFFRAGLEPVGLQCYLPRHTGPHLTALERGSRGRGR